VKITAALVAELDLLTQALDVPGTDVAQTMSRLATDARTAVASYLGLSVAVTASEEELDFTMIDEGLDLASARTSLLVPLSAPTVDGTTRASVALIFYAAAPGAFIDLAADLAWITGRDPADFRLNEHRTVPHSAADPAPLESLTRINQALGVLIGRGSTPEQAERDLYARAARTDSDIRDAAISILATLKPPTSESDGA
jgi:hypothetical protein